MFKYLSLDKFFEAIILVFSGLNSYVVFTIIAFLVVLFIYLVIKLIRTLLGIIHKKDLLFSYLFSFKFLRKKKKTPFIYNHCHEGFVSYCAEVLKKNGFTNVEINDQFDMVADKGTVNFYIRCKVCFNIIDDKLMEEIAIQKKQFDKSIGVIIANQSFLSSEVDLAKEYGNVLWDKEFLSEMAEIAEIESDNKDIWEKLVHE